MSKRDRRDMDGRDRDRDRRDGDRRDQYEDDQQRRILEGDIQEGDSLAALKTILSKVASQLKPLNLSADESIRLVEQLYGSVLQMDSALAGEADDTRKSSTLGYIQKTTIRREDDRLVVEFPSAEELRAAETAIAEGAPATAETSTQQTPPQPAAQAESRIPAPTGAPAESRPAESGEGPGRGPGGPGRPRPVPGRPPRGEQVPRGDQSARGGEGSMPPQTPRIDPAERGPAEREEPEGPEA